MKKLVWDINNQDHRDVVQAIVENGVGGGFSRQNDRAYYLVCGTGGDFQYAQDVKDFWQEVINHFL